MRSNRLAWALCVAGLSGCLDDVSPSPTEDPSLTGAPEARRSWQWSTDLEGDLSLEIEVMGEQVVRCETTVRIVYLAHPEQVHVLGSFMVYQGREVTGGLEVIGTNHPTYQVHVGAIEVADTWLKAEEATVGTFVLEASGDRFVHSISVLGLKARAVQLGEETTSGHSMELSLECAEPVVLSRVWGTRSPRLFDDQSLRGGVGAGATLIVANGVGAGAGISFQDRAAFTTDRSPTVFRFLNYNLMGRLVLGHPDGTSSWNIVPLESHALYGRAGEYRLVLDLAGTPSPVPICGGAVLPYEELGSLSDVDNLTA